jgi:NADH-quinone oxidoreductase subunit K
MIPLNYSLLLSAALFAIGVIGFIIRRNAIMIFMCVELMLNAANILFIAFAQAYGQIGGQIFVFFTISVAAAEVAIGLTLIVAIYRSRHTLDVDELSQLKG